MSRTLLLIGLVIGTLAVGVALYLFASLKKNDAPVLHGEVTAHVPFKGDLKLDLYLPTQQVHEQIPVLVYIHGGAWIAGSKISVNNARFNGAFNALREAGYAIVAPDYTLAKLGKTPFPACIEDAFAALAWVEQEAETYGFDLGNVGLLGESAGGHIAMMCTFAKAEDYGQSLSYEPTYLVDVYGPADLKQLYYDQVPLVDSIKQRVERLPEAWQDNFNLPLYLFGFDPATDAERADSFASLYSPVQFASAKAPPILMIHGDEDRVVPHSQSQLLQAKLEEVGRSYQFQTLEGVDHAFRGATEEQKAQVQQWITDFVLANYQRQIGT
ncbi:MAG: alpha/beta hydrolase [Bacteroidota bacterium]